MPKPDRVIDAKFEVVSPGADRAATWYPGRKELPSWFKTAMVVAAVAAIVLSRIFSQQDMREEAEARDAAMQVEASQAADRAAAAGNLAAQGIDPNTAPLLNPSDGRAGILEPR